MTLQVIRKFRPADPFWRGILLWLARAEFGDGTERSDEDILTALESMGYSLLGVRAFKRLEMKSGRAGDGSDLVVHLPRGLSDA